MLRSRGSLILFAGLSRKDACLELLKSSSGTFGAGGLQMASGDPLGHSNLVSEGILQPDVSSCGSLFESRRFLLLCGAVFEGLTVPVGVDCGIAVGWWGGERSAAFWPRCLSYG